MKVARTINHYLVPEVMSALQKAIRRGHEEEAMFWALELAESNAWVQLWNRLEVIVNEDIGLANAPLIVLVHTLREQAVGFREKKNDSWRLMLANAILSMCQSDKSREADHFQCVIRNRRLLEDWRIEIPDYAVDKHTSAGRKKGRGVDHFREEGTQLVPEHRDKYEEEAFRLWKKEEALKEARKRQSSNSGE